MDTTEVSEVTSGINMADCLLRHRHVCRENFKIHLFKKYVRL